MLKNLYQIPRSLEDRKALLRTSTGAVLHEVGHVVGSALAGIPADYVIIDEAPDSKRYSTYIHPKYRKVLAPDTSAQIRIAAAGFAAEQLIFGDALLDRSNDDLRSIASLLNITFNESTRLFIAQSAQGLYGPIIPPAAVDVVRVTYSLVTAALESRRYQFAGANVIPFYVFCHPGLPISRLRRLTAILRTRAGTGRSENIAALRNGVRSGL